MTAAIDQIEIQQHQGMFTMTNGSFEARNSRKAAQCDEARDDPQDDAGDDSSHDMDCSQDSSVNEDSFAVIPSIVDALANIPSLEKLDMAASAFAVLTCPIRLRLMFLIEAGQCGELRVAALARLVDQTPSTVSHHLTRLRSQNLIIGKRRSTTMTYKLTDGGRRMLRYVRQTLQVKNPG